MPQNYSDYSDEISESIRNFLEDDDWNFDFDDEEGSFRFGLNLRRCKFKSIKYYIKVRESDYVVYAVCPLAANVEDKEGTARISELLHRINYGMFIGNYELDHRDGEIRYKCFVDCENSYPSNDVIRNSIYLPGHIYERFGNAIASVLFTDVSPEEAYIKAEDEAED